MTSNFKLQTTSNLKLRTSNLLTMHWYLAKIVFRIICGDGDHTPQFDEQLRLVQARDEDEAFFKAQAIGDQEEVTFLNVQNKEVQWQFINVSELYRLSALIDGAELYSRISETDEADEYIGLIHKRAQSIQEKSSHKLLHLL